MNERIRELYEQARLNAKSIDPDIDPKGWMDEYHEKFAELIVRECMRYINEDYKRDFDSLWREDLSKGIKEHFGVES